MDQAQSDEALLGRLAKQDSHALKLLFSRHSARVFRFIQRTVRNEAVAEELTNEVFLDVWRQAGQFAGQSSPSTWILSMARNKAISSLRRRREQQLPDESEYEQEDEAPGPEDTVLVDNKAHVLRRCLAVLSVEHREVIDLVYYHDKGVEEVASITGIPVGTVKTRLFNARKKLSEAARQAGLDRGWP
mgnify:CR=1 FL=1